MKTSKATTEPGKEADMEYHIDVNLVIHENVHHLKLKCFNSNCRIQVQHIGKGPHQPQSHLKGRSPPKFFTEEILFPIAKSINDDINLEKEKEFVIHLKKEIARLKKISKAMPKTNNKKNKCVNSDCKYHNSLDIANVEKYGECSNCEGYEHFNCANIDAQRKAIYQTGSQKYICTECLTNYPILALQITSKEAITDETVAKEPETNDNSIQPVEHQVEISVPVEANPFKDFIFNSPS